MKRWSIALFLILLTTGVAFAAPKTAAEYLAAAAQLYSAKDYQGAAYSYEAGLVLDPNNAGGYQGLGDCYYYLGRQTDAMTAYQKSLALNPSNPKLTDFIKTFKPQDAAGASDGTTITMFSQMQATPVIDYSNTNSEPSTVKSKPEVKFAIDKSTWIRFSAGYDFALLSDFNNGVNAQQTLLDSNPNSTTATTTSTGSNGFRAGGEFGVDLDQGNGFSISFENVWTQGIGYNNNETQTLVDGSGTTVLAPQSESFQPGLFNVSLNYYAYLPAGKDSRAYFTVGGGYYQATVGFVGVDPTLSPTNENGTFTDSAFGWTFGFGDTLAVGNSFGLTLSARGRIVAFNQMTTTSVNNSTNSGPYAIVIDNSTSTTAGTINVTPVSNINATSYRYAVLDYTGFDADLSFAFYF